MKVKFNGEMSKLLTLIGGGPQGTLLGGLEYIVQSNDNADIVPVEDRFKYIDDLSVLQLVCLSGLLVEYNFFEHVASDIGIDDQRKLDETERSKVKLYHILKIQRKFCHKTEN